MPFSIAIIGAGPAGLTLARLLQVSAIDASITIFERDASPTSRIYQGGTLDLHTDTGLAALQKAELWDEALKHLRYEGEEMFLADKNNTVILHMNEEAPKQKSPGVKRDHERPEMDREVLKNLLLQSVKPECVQWGKTLQSVDTSTGVLSFRDGTTAGPFDLVVGADGAWSKVRHVLTDIRPRYSGICGFEADIANPKEEHPKLSKMVGHGSYFAYGDSKMLGAQRLGNGNIKVGMWLKKEDHETYAADLMAAYGGDEEKLKEKILENFQDWHPRMKQWVKVCHRVRPWPLYELPVGEFWEHKKGYTLIGDASSLMTPFAGEGVNKAMKDALELAEALETGLQQKANGDALDEAVRKYEVNMFPRAKMFQRETMQNKNGMFSPNGVLEFMTGMVDAIAERSGTDLTKGWVSWVPFKTLIFCYVSTLQFIGSWRRRVGEVFSGSQG